MSRALGPAVLLLGLAIVINYIDRGNLSIAAPLLKDELQITATQLGVLFSAFFWTYTALQIPAGWIVDHYDVNPVIAFCLGFSGRECWIFIPMVLQSRIDAPAKRGFVPNIRTMPPRLLGILGCSLFSRNQSH